MRFASVSLGDIHDFPFFIGDDFNLLEIEIYFSFLGSSFIENTLEF
jgi:hypothetical protein